MSKFGESDTVIYLLAVAQIFIKTKEVLNLEILGGDNSN